MPAHVKCLLIWIEKKCQKKKKHKIIHYDFSQLKCDICTTSYPSEIFHKGKKTKIIDIIPKENKDFVILDILNINGGISGSVVCTFTRNSNSITVGRSDKNDMIFKDISVSRGHGQFQWINQKLYVFDKDSKFGTYDLLEKRIKISKIVNRKLVMDCFQFEIHTLNLKKSKCHC